MMDPMGAKPTAPIEPSTVGVSVVGAASSGRVTDPTPGVRRNLANKLPAAAFGSWMNTDTPLTRMPDGLRDLGHTNLPPTTSEVPHV